MSLREGKVYDQEIFNPYLPPSVYGMPASTSECG